MPEQHALLTEMDMIYDIAAERIDQPSCHEQRERENRASLTICMTCCEDGRVSSFNVNSLEDEYAQGKAQRILYLSKSTLQQRYISPFWSSGKQVMSCRAGHITRSHKDTTADLLHQTTLA